MSIVNDLVRDYFCRRPDPVVLQRHLNDQMAAYEERESRRRETLLARASQPDDEGFVTVVNRTPLPDLKAAEGGEEVGLTDFYRFQTRQSRANQLDELRRRFEDDRARIAVLKRNKLFKE